MAAWLLRVLFGGVISFSACQASAAYEWIFHDVKILHVESFNISNDAVRIYLDLSDYATLPQPALDCAPTNTAWVVSLWSLSNKDSVLAIALAAQAMGGTVDILVNTTDCNVSNSYPLLPAAGNPTPEGSIVHGLGLRLRGIRMTAN